MTSPFEQALVLLTEGLRQAQSASAGGPEFSRVFVVADAAVSILKAHTEGQRFPSEGAPRIVLRRSGSSVTLAVDSSLDVNSGRREIERWVAGLRKADEVLENTAELIGLLLGLCAHWAAAGFAPPAVVRSLKRCAPRLLELGRGFLDGGVRQGGVPGGP